MGFDTGTPKTENISGEALFKTNSDTTVAMAPLLLSVIISL